MVVAQIAADRIALPQRKIVFLEGGHQPRRIHRAVCRGIGLAERAAYVDTLVGKVQLLQRPDHLHHVAGRGAAPENATHGGPPERFAGGEPSLHFSGISNRPKERDGGSRLSFVDGPAVHAIGITLRRLANQGTWRP